MACIPCPAEESPVNVADTPNSVLRNSKKMEAFLLWLRERDLDLEVELVCFWKDAFKAQTSIRERPDKVTSARIQDTLKRLFDTVDKSLPFDEREINHFSKIMNEKNPEKAVEILEGALQSTFQLLCGTIEEFLYYHRK